MRVVPAFGSTYYNIVTAIAVDVCATRHGRAHGILGGETFNGSQFRTAFTGDHHGAPDILFCLYFQRLAGRKIVTRRTDHIVAITIAIKVTRKGDCAAGLVGLHLARYITQHWHWIITSITDIVAIPIQLIRIEYGWAVVSTVTNAIIIRIEASLVIVTRATLALNVNVRLCGASGQAAK
ncbi:MAG: hypothetical protein R3E67_08520 [Pseudomonadales bacterium]